MRTIARHRFLTAIFALPEPILLFAQASDPEHLLRLLFASEKSLSERKPL